MQVTLAYRPVSRALPRVQGAEKQAVGESGRGAQHVACRAHLEALRRQRQNWFVDDPPALSLSVFLPLPREGIWIYYTGETQWKPPSRVNGHVRRVRTVIASLTRGLLDPIVRSTEPGVVILVFTTNW